MRWDRIVVCARLESKPSAEPALAPSCKVSWTSASVRGCCSDGDVASVARVARAACRDRGSGHAGGIVVDPVLFHPLSVARIVVVDRNSRTPATSRDDRLSESRGGRDISRGDDRCVVDGRYNGANGPSGRLNLSPGDTLGKLLGSKTAARTNDAVVSFTVVVEQPFLSRNGPDLSRCSKARPEMSQTCSAHKINAPKLSTWLHRRAPPVHV